MQLIVRLILVVLFRSSVNQARDQIWTRGIVMPRVLQCQFAEFCHFAIARGYAAYE